MIQNGLRTQVAHGLEPVVHRIATSAARLPALSSDGLVPGAAREKTVANVLRALASKQTALSPRLAKLVVAAVDEWAARSCRDVAGYRQAMAALVMSARQGMPRVSAWLDARDIFVTVDSGGDDAPAASVSAAVP